MRARHSRVVLDNRNWMHPFNDEGHRCGYKDIPHSVNDLIDDPFRSLAGELRRAGGFAKDTTPFSEFLWADFLRRRIKRKLIENDFNRALETAIKLAKSSGCNLLTRLVRSGAERLNCLVRFRTRADIATHPRACL